MKKLDNAVEKVQDPATREALRIIAEEMRRIEGIQPVGENLKQIAYAVNKLTGKLK